ncbi:MAG: hypothetical protein KGJ79_16800 [Alphaproteobacteria bacterium]|nr:hypothetical protein [Alphaproteobacteria bacterium]MDE2495701.1 hypothetical protein [Alphaproteobacteria bacterium]
MNHIDIPGMVIVVGIVGMEIQQGFSKFETRPSLARRISVLLWLGLLAEVVARNFTQWGNIYWK